MQDYKKDKKKARMGYVEQKSNKSENISPVVPAIRCATCTFSPPQVRPCTAAPKAGKETATQDAQVIMGNMISGVMEAQVVNDLLAHPSY